MSYPGGYASGQQPDEKDWEALAEKTPSSEKVECQCAYDKAAAHPNCERDNATFLVSFAPNNMDIIMCRWCAEDWKRRHPTSVEIIEVN